MPHRTQHALGKKQQKKQAHLHPLNLIRQYKFKGSLEVSREPDIPGMFL